MISILTIFLPITNIIMILLTIAVEPLNIELGVIGVGSLVKNFEMSMRQPPMTFLTKLLIVTFVLIVMYLLFFGMIQVSFSQSDRCFLVIDNFVSIE